MIRYAHHLRWIDSQQERMARLVREWADINTHSHNVNGLEECAAAVSREYDCLAAETTVLPLDPVASSSTLPLAHSISFAPALRIVKRPTASRRVFLGIHLDTVYPVDHPFQKCEMIDARTLRGPGVADAKGGMAILLVAVETLERSEWAREIGWEILLNTDEEIGSPGSAPLLAAAARRNQFGLVFEPALPGGALVSHRKGSGSFAATVTGRSAHAGRDPHLGRNAIHALAEFITAVASLNDPEAGVTVNVGHIKGGGPVNVVPDRAAARFNIRVGTTEQQHEIERALQRLADEFSARDGLSLRIVGAFTSPPKPLDAPTQCLLDGLSACARDLGFELSWRGSGGASDGNKLAAAGLPTVDSLGACGGDIHSPNEYLLLKSLTERAKLTALFLMKFAASEIELPKADHDMANA